MDRRITAQKLPIVWALLFGLGLHCPFLSAQDLGKHSSKGDVPTSFARRIVKTFDFEEKRLGNLEDIPMNWDKVTKSGYTHYISGRIDEDVGCPAPSFKLQLNGGNLGYVFSERLIPAFPGSDHKVIAYVKTRNLKNARGFVQGFYMDRSGKMLGDTIAYSPLIGPAGASDPEWRPVTVDLPFTNTDGRFIGLGIFLVQEDQLPARFTTPIRSYRKDIDVALWIDEITVLRLPKVRLKLAKELPLYDTRESVVLGATVADAKTDDLTARITIQDLASDTTRSTTQPVAVLPPLEAILRGRRTAPGLLSHNLGALRPGLYRVSLEVLSHREVIVTKTVTIAVLNHSRPVESGGDFGVDLSNTRFRRPDLPAAFVGDLQPAWVILPLWRQDTPVSRKSSDPSAAEQMILQINHRGVSVVGAFLDVPQELETRIRILNPSLWDLLSASPEVWQFELSTVLSRHADRIDRWIFGKASDCWQTPDPRIGPRINALRKEFSQFQGQYSLLAPWPAMVDPPGDRPADGYVVTVPPELVSGSFSNYFAAWGNRTGSMVAILPGPDLAQVQFRPAMRDFILRFLNAKRAGIRQLAAQDLWTNSDAITPDGLEPTVYYPAYANLIDRLGGMEYLGNVEVSPDRSGLLFGSADRACLVLADAREECYRSTITLGDHLKAYDIWGRTLPITQRASGWEIAYRPIVFLDGIDPDLARFIASIQFEPAMVPSRFGPHPVKLVFKNTFPQGLSGLVHIQGPASWQFDPSGSRLALPAGKEFSLPMRLRYPSTEPIGTKSVQLRFELEAKKPVRLSVLLPVRLGVSDLEMRVIWFVRNGEMIVQQEVLNNGLNWTDLMAFTIAPGRPRMERQIRRLGPRQTAIKEYSLGPWRQAMGQTIRVGFREVRGNRLANEMITLE